MKKCYKCGELKEFSEFGKNKSKKEGLSGLCKPCKKVCDKLYQEANKENKKKYDKTYYSINRERVLKQRKIHREANREKIRKTKKAYQEANKEKIKKYKESYYEFNKKEISKKRKEYYEVNKERINKHRRNRLKTDIDYKLSERLRIRLNSAIKNNQKTGSAVRDLGCSINKLKTHLESQFEPGMSWDNWSHDGWHIDHIIPLSSFNLSKREELLKACHYTNLQPMWAKDNLKKGNKILK